MSAEANTGSGVTNPDAAQDALDTLREKRVSANGDPDIARGLEASQLLEELNPDAAEPSYDGPYEMSNERRVGTVKMQVTGDEESRFGRPNVFASRELDEQLEMLGSGPGGSAEFHDWLLETVAEWSLDPSKDVEYWGANFTVIELTQVVRNLTLGGNAPRR